MEELQKQIDGQSDMIELHKEIAKLTVLLEIAKAEKDG